MASLDEVDDPDETNQPVVIESAYVPKDLICSICLCVPLHPVVTPICEHVFCYDCLQVAIAQNDDNDHCCPIDRRPCDFDNVITTIPDGSFIHRIWSNINIRCGYAKSKGCTWTGSIADYNYHTSTNTCPNGRATNSIVRRNDEHVQDDDDTTNSYDDRWTALLLQLNELGYTNDVVNETILEKLLKEDGQMNTSEGTMDVSLDKFWKYFLILNQSSNYLPTLLIIMNNRIL